MDQIEVFIINLKKRPDRLKHVQQQFYDKPEFKLNIIEAHEHEIGAIGLWMSIKKVLDNPKVIQMEYFVICEDDHVFTSDYNKDVFFNCITEASKKNADILSGGVSWFTNAFSVSKHLFWVEKFSGFQFTVIFKKFFRKLSEIEFKETDDIDYKVSSITAKKFFVYPFISNQYDSGYSDVTMKNNKMGRVPELYSQSARKAKYSKYFCDYYQRNSKVLNINTEIESYSDLKIPTYVINLPERIDRLNFIMQQFEGKEEFDVKIIEAIKHEIGAVGLWQSIRKIVTTAIEQDDDIIIICEDDHEFTSDYSKDFLIKNIIEAYYQRIELLNGGIGGYALAIPVSMNKFWISGFFSTQFVIIFKPLFQKILDYSFKDSDTADGVLSALTTYKMALFPFISVQKEFGYSDVTNWNNGSGAVTRWFKSAGDGLEMTLRCYIEFIKPEWSKTSKTDWNRSLESLLEELVINEDSFRVTGKIEFLRVGKTIAAPERVTEQKIIALVPYYNAEKYIQECYQSLIEQDYKNFKLYFLDDNSTDRGLCNIGGDSRLVLHKFTRKGSSLASIHYALTSNKFDGEDIIILVDGDDFLLNDQVFNDINGLYQRNNCLVSYGQYMYTNGEKGHCSPYSFSEFQRIRFSDWRASHLKTFKFKVFKELLEQDPNVESFKNNEGAFFDAACDVALMTPLLEIAGFKNVVFNQKPVYGYRLHKNNVGMINRKRQFEMEREILSKPRFFEAFS